MPPRARRSELAGTDHLPSIEDAESFGGEIQEFAAGSRPVKEVNRVLDTVVQTDIVNPTRELRSLAIATGARCRIKRVAVDACDLSPYMRG